MTPKGKNRGVLTYVLIAAILVVVMLFILPKLSSSSGNYEYSDIIKYFDNYQVSEYSLDLGSGELEMTLDNHEKIKYSVPSVNIFLDDTKDYRKEYNQRHPAQNLKVDYVKVRDNSWIISLIPTLLLLALMIATFVFMVRQTGGGRYTSFGKANIKELQKGRTATFDDVAGAEEEKHELEEIVDFLKNPSKFDEIGAKIPRGVLLTGPPGTGKTLLARAVAGEAGCTFYPISGSDFVEMFVGVGASRVRDLFAQAKKNAPAIIFIDEIDAVGRQRGAGLGGGNDEREQTLNQLLVEMDGFSGKEGVIVIAATNRPDILDPALLRPGRFDRRVSVGYPDVKGREAILKVHTRNKPLAPDVDLHVIAQTTVGFTGAELENLVNEAALLAARKNKKAITMPEIEEATIKVVAGPEKKSREISLREKRLTAYHESGHAVCTYYTEHTDDVHEISIIPRGMAGGYTMSLPEKDKEYVTKNEMYENIVVLLGGRVSESIFLEDVSTGASNDLERATKTARSMVTKYGFSEKLGPVVYGGNNNSDEVFLGRDFNSTPSYSDEVASKIDEEIRNIIEKAYKKTYEILNSHKQQIHLLAKYLIENEKIDKVHFDSLMNDTLDDKEVSHIKSIDTDFYKFPEDNVVTE